MIRPPAPRPCESCPYRCDVPSGVWSEEEYAKLPEYDGPTWSQPPSVFQCHQQDDRLCAGWVAVHDMPENLGLRIAGRELDPADLDAIVDYTTDVPLFASGQEAADHGRREIERPSPEAIGKIRKLERQRRVRS